MKDNLSQGKIALNEGDYLVAFKFFSSAAQIEHSAEAVFIMGTMYQTGKGVLQNIQL